jgi:hypothetical protein
VIRDREPCVKGAPSKRGKGQEFCNDRERNPTTGTGISLTRIVGHDQSAVIIQQPQSAVGLKTNTALALLYTDTLVPTKLLALTLDLDVRGSHHIFALKTSNSAFHANLILKVAEEQRKL